MVVLICVAAALTSALTLFSGFGLGTLLMPVFALVFPVDAAVALTAIVHFLNNLFKLALLRRHADRGVALRFGVPAVLAALLGAWLLALLTGLEPWLTYEISGRPFHVRPVNLVVAILMMLFAVLEAVPVLEKITINRKFLPLGGAISGFLGGISGHQGALRAAFLIRSSLTKEAFVATGVVIACMVDVSRLSVYAATFSRASLEKNGTLLAAAAVSAFLGAYLGSRLLHRVTLRAVQWIVSVLLFIAAIGLGSGLLGS